MRTMTRRALPLSVAAALAVVLAIAGPALSLKRWRPDPVDFEYAPAAAELRGSAALEVDPGKRFNLVGLRWVGGGEPDIEMRSRRDGGRWTAWVKVRTHQEDAPDPGRESGRDNGVSDPVWVGEADEVQVRGAKRLRRVRFHFVNATGTATAADRARTALRRSVNSGLVSLARTLDPDAEAQEQQPPIVPREAWGAQDCPPRSPPSYGEVKAAFVHHTVTTNEYTPAEAPAAVLAVCRYHRNSNGWDDIGYNFVVDKYGTIYEGRAGGVDQAVIGAQAAGYNAQTTGISNLGTYTDVGQSEAALDAMARLIRWKLPLHGQPTSGSVTVTSAGGSSNRYPAGTQVTLDRISGHRDGNATACPGDSLYAQLPDLRARAAGVPAAARTRIEAGAAAAVTYPNLLRLTGRLTGGSGEPIAGARVEIEQLKRSGAWQRAGVAMTADDGAFAESLRPASRRTLRARFPGDGDRAESVSAQTLVQVMPDLTIARSPSRLEAGRLLTVTGSIGPYRTRLTLLLERKVRSRYRRAGSFALRPSRAPRGRLSYGDFARRLRLRRPGLYRVYAFFPGDARNAFARTPARYLRVTPSGGGASPAPRR
jgi:hypothetical protein